MNKLFVSLLVVFSISTICTGCRTEEDLFGMTRVKVISVYPPDRYENMDPAGVITVTFDRAMDRERTSSEFSLNSGDGSVSGFFSWEEGNSKMIFRPAKPLSGGCIYKIAIGVGSEDTDGNDLERDYSSIFYVNSDITAPEVVSYNPANGQTGVVRDTSISFSFSEPMDVTSVFDGITVSPSTEFLYKWSSQNSYLQLVPYNKLKNGTTYTVNVGKSLRDAAGNTILKTFAFSFTVGSDFTSPIIESITQGSSGTSLVNEQCVNGVEKNGDFDITFNELIDLNSVVGMIAFSPSAEVFVQGTASGTKTVLRVHPLENLTSEKRYTMTVDKAITDLNGNSLTGDYRYSFVVNGSHSTRPVVEGITQKFVTDPYWTDNPHPVTLNSSVLPDVFIVFSESVKPTSVNVSIEMVNGKSTLQPLITGIHWDPKDGQPNRILRFNISELVPPSGVDPDIYDYKLVVKGGNSGVMDIDANAMSEDFVQFIKM